MGCGGGGAEEVAAGEGVDDHRTAVADVHHVLALEEHLLGCGAEEQAGQLGVQEEIFGAAQVRAQSAGHVPVAAGQAARVHCAAARFPLPQVEGYDGAAGAAAR